MQYRSARSTARAMDATAGGPSLHDQGFRVVSVPEGRDADDFLAELEGDPDVITAERDAPVFATATPNDPFYAGSQSAYMNVLNAPQAWDLHTGSSQVAVAVIDSGIDTQHSDFSGRLWRNPVETANGIDDDGNGCIDDLHGCRFINLTPERQQQCGYSSSTPTGDVRDDHGSPGDSSHSHGTMVSGIIGAAGNNGIGVAGVAWDVRIMPLKVLDCGTTANGGSPSGEMSNVALAIDYARIMGADIINLSLASQPGDEAANTAMLRNAIAAAEAAGIIIVASAGNYSGAGVGYPAAYTQFSNIISVGASQTGTGDTWATYSSYGPSVDIAAPGNSIASTTRSDLGLPSLYGSAPPGTSYAAPLVSGMFALMQSRNSRLPMEMYIEIALANASPAQPAAHGGNWSGAGIANIGDAVAALPMTLTGAPLHDWTDVPAGATVQAMIDGVECASTTSTMIGPIARFALHVAPAAEKTGCGQVGRTVRVYIDGRPADPPVPWSVRNADLGIINHNVSSVSPPPGGVVVQTLSQGWSLVAQFSQGGAMPQAVSYLPTGWTHVARLVNGPDTAPHYELFADGLPRYAQTLAAISQFDVLWVNGPPSNLALPNPNAPPRSVQLHEGWNVFLHTGPHTRVQDALAEIEGTYSQVLQFDASAGAWKVFMAGQPRYFNDFGGLMELEIYWIHMSAPATLEMP